MTTSDQPSHAHADGPFRQIPPEECYELLSTTTVGRVAFVNANGLQLLPLNFAVIDGGVFFRTAPDSVLDDLAKGLDEVAFGVDYHAEAYRNGWNVTVRGSTVRVSDPVIYERVMSWSKLRPWAGGSRAVVIQLIPRDIDGRRVHSR